MRSSWISRSRGVGGGGGPRSRTRAGGAATKATGVAQALGDLRGDDRGVRADGPETRGFEMRRTKKKVYLAVLALELLELAADVLSRLLCRGGHRRRPSRAGREEGLGLAALGLATWERWLGVSVP